MTCQAELLAGSLLAEPEALPLLPSATVERFGRTLVVAPHPDDESLGCGGALALLRQAGLPVHILLVSDGSGSHPGSRRYPPAKLAALREEELRAALRLLGVQDEALTCLRLPDRHVPRRGSAGFVPAVARAIDALRAIETPDTLLLPWRRDPHTDHRASWELLDAALATLGWSARRIEYPIWAWRLGEPGDAPRAGEVRGWRLDVSPVLGRKLAAVTAHRSQTTPLIDDAEAPWWLTPAVLARFSQPWELYLEP